ncbi:MAG: alanyl-tRNA editing protein [Acetobacteraceae bacterium]|nr:alanyl-tRNA editing protein [Acetobacteraceae bacterium]
MTERLFLDDSYLQTAEAIVVAAEPGRVVLDRSPFYARSGGQPGDRGTLTWEAGALEILEATKGDADTIHHVTALDAALPAPGARVHATIDFPQRHRLMRMHTALHLLCSLLPGAAVTGGQIGADRSRLDLDLAEAPDKAALERGLAELIAAAHPVSAEWVDEAVLDTNPGLVRTLSVQPPRGTGRLRLVRIGAGAQPVDLQPCGGTHVRNTGEIGGISVVKVENKGRQNRRIALALVDA